MAIKSDGTVIIDVDADLKKFNSKVSSLASAAVKGFTAVGAVATGAAALVIKTGAEFESAFAGVRKTVDATEEEFEELKKGILDMSTAIPKTASELSSIAEAAGQLGIQKDKILKFTETMANLGEATNLSGEAAATTLARFANITGMSQENFDRLGSSIVALGNNLATTESEIADMALSIAGAGHAVGLTETQILAFSASLSSVGIEAQAGGTAMSTLLINMKKATVEGGQDLEEFAKVAGMTGKEFKQAFEKDAAQAVVKFIEGLSTAEQRGTNAFKLLSDAGINEARMTKAMLNLSGASEMLVNSLELSGKAWEENTALANEAAQRYETTESKMKVLQNTLTRTGITAFEKFKVPFKDALDTGIESLNDLNAELEGGRLGGKVDKLANAFSDMAGGLMEAGVKAVPVFVKGLELIVDYGDDIIKVGASIGAGLGLAKGVAMISKLSQGYRAAALQVSLFSLAQKSGAVTSLAALTKTELAVGLLTGKIKLATAAQMAWNAMTPVGWLTLGVAAVGALTAGLVLYSQKTNETTARLKEHNKALEDAKTSMDNLTSSSLESYQSKVAELQVAERYTSQLIAMTDANGNLIGSKEEIQAKIDALNSALGESIYFYDEEKNRIYDNKGAVDDLRSSIENLIIVKKGQAWIDANQEAYTEALKQQRELTEQNIETQKEYNKILADNSADKAKVNAALELRQAHIDGKLAYDEYNEAVERLNLSASDNTAVTQAYKLYEALKESGDAIASNQELIRGFEDMQAAIASTDTEKINSIVYGISSVDPTSVNDLKNALLEVKKASEELALLNEQKQMGISVDDGVYNATLSKLDTLKKSVTDMTGVDYDASFGNMGVEAFNSYIEALSTQASSGQEQVNQAITTSFAGAKDTMIAETTTSATAAAENTATTYGNTLNAQLPDKGSGALDLMFNQMNSKINGMRLNPLYVEILPKVNSSAWAQYGGVPGGATFDGSIGGSIIPDFATSLVNSSRNVLKGIQSRISFNITQNRETRAISGGEKHVSIAQTNNFNIPVEKPSEAMRRLERTNKELAKDIN